MFIALRMERLRRSAVNDSMSNGRGKREIAYWAAAIILFAAAAVFFWPKGKISTKAEAVFLGNSIIGSERGESSIPVLVGNELGISIYNAGFGGTCAAKIHYDEQRDYSDDSLSLAALTRAIVYRDFASQQTIHPTQSAAHYFEGNVDELEKIDFDSVNTVFIYYGNNDFFIGATPENSGDAYDEYTFAGAFRSSLRRFKKEYPDIRIIVISPAFFWTLDGIQKCTEYDNSVADIETYISILESVSKEYGVEYIDLFHGLFNQEEDWKKYTADGVHPNEYGRTLIAEAIVDYMRTTK